MQIFLFEVKLSNDSSHQAIKCELIKLSNAKEGEFVVIPLVVARERLVGLPYCVCVPLSLSLSNKESDRQHRCFV